MTCRPLERQELITISNRLNPMSSFCFSRISATDTRYSITNRQLICTESLDRCVVPIIKQSDTCLGESTGTNMSADSDANERYCIGDECIYF